MLVIAPELNVPDPALILLLLVTTGELILIGVREPVPIFILCPTPAVVPVPMLMTPVRLVFTPISILPVVVCEDPNISTM